MPLLVVRNVVMVEIRSERIELTSSFCQYELVGTSDMYGSTGISHAMYRYVVQSLSFGVKCLLIYP